MSNTRKIKRVVAGQNAVDGAGVSLMRVFGYHDVKDFDPFLMLDAFDSSNSADYVKGFPWHPHRGIETVTYLLEGEIDHGDNLGNAGIIGAGDCQWMTAGSGILHQEMPQESPRLFGAQLWLNLPAKDKMTVPKYHDIKAEKIPVIEEENAKIRIISGEYKSQKGATTGEHVQATYLDVEIAADAKWTFELPANDTLFVYILQGEGNFEKENDDMLGEKRAVLFFAGEHLFVHSGKSGVRFLLVSAKPLKEPIAWGGPIVMNTQEELDKAFEELNDGSFIKK
ncbi:MAG: pirin family protein [bacterium]